MVTTDYEFGNFYFHSLKSYELKGHYIFYDQCFVKVYILLHPLTFY